MTAEPPPAVAVASAAAHDINESLTVLLSALDLDEIADATKAARNIEWTVATMASWMQRHGARSSAQNIDAVIGAVGR